MRYKDLKEAPIGDLDIIGDTESLPNSEIRSPAGLTKRDIGPIVNPKGRAKIFKAFEKTPFLFNFYLIADTEHLVKVFNKHGLNVTEEQFEELTGRLPDPNAISFIIGSNFTNKNNYVPLTGWMLAHRLIHAPQIKKQLHTAEIGKLFFTSVNKLLLNPQTKEAKVYKKYGSEFLDIANANYESSIYRLIFSMLTMRSARMKKLSPLDIFPELIAQFLITGKVTFNKLTGEEGIDLAQSTELTNLMIKQLEDRLNAKIPEMLQSLVGTQWRLFW